MDTCLAMRPALVAALMRYCGDREVAEEATQDALLSAFQQGDRLAEVERLWGWLWRVGTNHVHTHHRRVACERRALSKLGPPTQTVADASEGVATMLLLDHLSGRYRSALWLRIVEQRSVAETAEALSCAEGTVKSLTHRAAARLRAHIAA